MKANKPSKPRFFYDEDFHNWTIKFCSDNYFRVASFYDIEDLVQECQIKFFHCQKRYYHIEKRGHFFSLYRSSCRNLMHDLANKVTRENDAMVKYASEVPYSAMSKFNLGELSRLIEEAPDEVGNILRLILSEQVTEAWRQEPVKRLGLFRERREKTNDRLCRILGVEKGSPVREMVRSYLEGITDDFHVNEDLSSFCGTVVRLSAMEGKK